MCRVKLKRPIAILNHVLVKLQFAVTQRAVAESNDWNEIGVKIREQRFCNLYTCKTFANNNNEGKRMREKAK